MNPLLKTIAGFIVKPFIEKKLHEYQSTNDYDAPRAHPAQASSQIAKIGAGGSLAMLTQVDSVEMTVASIAALLINLFFLYRPEKKQQ